MPLPFIGLAALPWRLIGAGALALSVAAAVWWIPRHFKEIGRDEVRAEWNAQKAVDAANAAARMAEVSEDNRKRLEAAQADTIANESKLRQEIKNAQTARARLVDDLVAGRVRIRPFNDTSGNAPIPVTAGSCLDDATIAGLQQRVAGTLAIAKSCQAERDAAVDEVIDRTRAVNER